MNTLQVDLIIEGEERRIFVTLTKPETGGMNPLNTDSMLMAYGTRQDLGETTPTWHYFPVRNLVSHHRVKGE